MVRGSLSAAAARINAAMRDGLWSTVRMRESGRAAVDAGTRPFIAASGSGRRRAGSGSLKILRERHPHLPGDALQDPDALGDGRVRVPHRL
jgi:hypothetical protein